MKQQSDLHELLAVQTTAEFDAEHPNRQAVTGVRPLVPMVALPTITKEEILERAVELLKAENEALRAVAQAAEDFRLYIVLACWVDESTIANHLQEIAKKLQRARELGALDES